MKSYEIGAVGFVNFASSRLQEAYEALMILGSSDAMLHFAETCGRILIAHQPVSDALFPDPRVLPCFLIGCLRQLNDRFNLIQIRRCAILFGTANLVMRLPLKNDPAHLIALCRQRVIKRNWKFNVVPKIILGVISILFVWEIVRINIDKAKAEAWPWRLQLVPIAPIASLFGVFVVLILARSQYAMSVRPSISWSANAWPSSNISSSAWTIYFMNAGPGVANIESIVYEMCILEKSSIKMIRGNKMLIEEKLSSTGLSHDEDFHFQLLTQDAPLPVAKTAKDGVEFAAFSKKALQQIHKLDFIVRVVDTVGDIHEKSLPLVATLPKKLQPKNSQIHSSHENIDEIKAKSTSA
jgi:hypothetical protein